MNYQVNYDLIGSMSKLDIFRDSLPTMIAEYEAGREKAMLDRATLTQAFKTGGPQAVAKFMTELQNDPKVMKRAALGVTIELCAQHFYGIETGPDSTIAETIELMKSIDSELEAG